MIDRFIMVTQQPEEGRRNATEEEIKDLPHVVDSVSVAVWVALIANATERFTFYAVTTPWRMHPALFNSTPVGLQFT
jgi:POT family proton-dependent oligopeptide transporter